MEGQTVSFVFSEPIEIKADNPASWYWNVPQGLLLGNGSMREITLANPRVDGCSLVYDLPKNWSRKKHKKIIITYEQPIKLSELFSDYRTTWRKNITRKQSRKIKNIKLMAWS